MHANVQVHFFQDIGYRHNSMKHCPSHNRNQCACDAIEAVEFHTPSFGRCHAQWVASSDSRIDLNDLEVPVVVKSMRSEGHAAVTAR